MTFTSKDKFLNKSQSKEHIFLAGSMATKPNENWREEVINKLEDKFHFFDPTNNKHNQLNDFQMREHIEWELEALQIADKIVLNFLPNSESPISLVELGLYVSTNKLIVICPKDFYKSRYVHVLCKKYNTPYYNNISDALNEIQTN